MGYSFGGQFRSFAFFSEARLIGQESKTAIERALQPIVRGLFNQPGALHLVAQPDGGKVTMGRQGILPVKPDAV